MGNHGGAFVSESIVVEPLGSGVLQGFTFAVKDVFGVKGYRNGAGNPDWLRSHPPADRHAEAIVKLLAQGAKLTGTTHTDELMYSLNGENFHYGTPINPKTPDRIPGGSSSGSAVAVAGGAVDFALGTDTGGSVRIPSAYCGVFGFRPSHGVVPDEGVIPLAPSFDTVGWMARSSKVLYDVGAVLMDGSASSGNPFHTIYWASDVWALADDACREALLRTATSIGRLAERNEWLDVAGDDLPAWSQAFRVLQGIEIWKEHGQWVMREKPKFGPGIAERMVWVSKLTEADSIEPSAVREAAIKRMDGLLGENGIVVMPTAPSLAPPLQGDGDQVESLRKRTQMMTCIAGLAGLPQATIPLTEVNGCPVGLSVMAGRDQDFKLLAWVDRLTKSLKVGSSIDEPN